MTTIGICDDDKRELIFAENAARAYFSARGREVEIHTFNCPSAFLDSLAINGYSVVLLDVCMPGLTGIDVAREIRRSHTECCIIFLTTSREYAVEAFEVDAVQYLIKPYTQSSFDEALDKAFARIDAPEKYIVKKSDGVIRRLAVEKIMYVESDKHYVDVYMNNGEVCRLRATVEELYDDLSPFGCFARPHKSFIVNMSYIKSVSAVSLIIGDKTIPVSKGKYATFKAEYVRFVFGKE